MAWWSGRDVYRLTYRALPSTRQRWIGTSTVANIAATADPAILRFGVVAPTGAKSLTATADAAIVRFVVATPTASLSLSATASPAVLRLQVPAPVPTMGGISATATAAVVRF